ncbi:Arm DNA-binding domain-containing protein [Enterobacter asburiae]|uniref:Arm DNA-binding domain-containing protein n=1 Tax=Enterobacter asburiae TaxID=61645 RepID=UPI0022CDBEB5|nr:Arm DNA-binding domain-containing protein [Enterobacter asburiae]
MKTYPSGRKTFVYRYFLNGKEKFVNLGDFPSVALAEAIEKASSAAKNISEPVKAVTDLSSIKQLFDDYIEDQKARGKRSYEKRRTGLTKFWTASTLIQGMLARDVTPDHIKRVLSEFISREPKPEQTRFEPIFMQFLTLAYLLTTIRQTLTTRPYTGLNATRYLSFRPSVGSIRHWIDFFPGMNCPSCWTSFIDLHRQFP